MEAGPDFPDEEEFPPGFVTGGEHFANEPVYDLDWGYDSEPLPNGRRMRLPRGRLVGGSSMTNGTICVRGAPDDFERWQARGAPGWGWDDVRPAYEAVESEVYLKRYGRDGWQPIQRSFYDGFVELGYREVDDLNAEDAWYGVVGPAPLNRRNTVRQGTLVTYIRKARPRPNFEVRGNALVDRVLFSGARATGIRYIDEDGHRVDVAADTVVLSAGAYGTPALLIRSGIGPADGLLGLGVDPLVDLPVGASLDDHPVCGFDLYAPELADVRAPSAAVYARDTANAWVSIGTTVDEAEGLCAVAFVLTAGSSEGTLTVTSLDPAVQPRIEHRYDLRGFDSAWETLGRLLATSPLSRVQRLFGERPLSVLLHEGVSTAFHPVGTCPIGKVVDDDLRVYGVEGLVVADASVFPAHVSNNPNLTCFMIGERAAAKLSGR